MNERNLERMKKKFGTACFVVKEELPIVKCMQILLLEKRHGVDVGNDYKNGNTGGSLLIILVIV